ncbi:hypothetical protein [Streptomyces halobius]|uniref:Small secreted domain DUF320 n=1 Tax=Streptomyces halobius TaxID=2879846 RepID=A0ABY4M2A0_9ACTN|nr:hypothetical protein [Streptomyces halobius]UQA91318.1 hypothetical protein K9S39_04980 [Streptomyces halobius]UQA91498.1 hypothetical protein K9S39_06105 [Streptomyces halobius]
MTRIRLAAGALAAAALLTIFGGGVANAAPSDNYGVGHCRAGGMFGDCYGVS